MQDRKLTRPQLLKVDQRNVPYVCCPICGRRSNESDCGETAIDIPCHHLVFHFVSSVAEIIGPDRDYSWDPDAPEAELNGYGIDEAYKDRTGFFYATREFRARLATLGGFIRLGTMAGSLRKIGYDDRLVVIQFTHNGGEETDAVGFDYGKISRNEGTAGCED